jgi:hypothetical protein
MPSLSIRKRRGAGEARSQLTRKLSSAVNDTGGKDGKRRISGAAPFNRKQKYYYGGPEIRYHRRAGRETFGGA